MALNQSNDNGLTFLIWDSEGQPPAGDWISVLWRGVGKDGGTPAHSIPRKIEEQADALRARFLAWIHDLGEVQIYGMRLVDHLVLRPGFSYWWMFLGVEKCNYVKLPHIYDSLRLLTIENLIGKNAAGRIILVSSDKTLVRAFRLWCYNADLAFEWRRLKGRAGRELFFKKLYRLLPHPVRALVWLLRYCLQRWPLRRVGAAQFVKSTARITFCSYFDNLDMVAACQDHFYSHYWTALPEVLAQDGSYTNWIQLYVRDESVPTAQQARGLITRINQSGGTAIQSHISLDSALCWSVVRGVVRDYARIVLMGLRLRKVRRQFRLAGSNVDLWSLFKQDWCESMFGATAISNCMFLNLFERTLKGMPRQKLGLYLQENQGWEKAFVHIWKAAGHGLLVGVPHSTVRYWDLRYFFDPRSYRHTGKNDLPLPDVVALNGPAAMAAYRKGGYPEDKITEVEALRYLYLGDSPKKFIKASARQIRPLRVLILTDYLPSITCAQMQMLVEAASLLPMETQYIVKAHPNCPVSVSDYLPVNLHLSRDTSIAKLLEKCDVVYTSNVTSAAVEAYSLDVPVISMLDGNAFNMSPLRGVPDVVFVSSPAELAQELLKSHQYIDDAKNHEYFTIDPNIPRWKSLLRTVSDA